MAEAEKKLSGGKGFLAGLFLKTEFKPSFFTFFNENRYLEVREVGNKFFEYVTHPCGPFTCRFEADQLFRIKVIATFVFLNAFY